MECFRNATMSSSGDVTYTGSHLNVGTCVNLSTGVFTAPVTGTYLYLLPLWVIIVALEMLIYFSI